MVSNFIADCITGRTTSDKIEDYIIRWHDGSGKGLRVYEFLGITEQEYFDWLSGTRSVENIVEVHREEIRNEP